MNALLKKLNIDETYTKAIKKPIWDSVKQNTYPKQDYNFMADVLFLPETKEKYKYLLVVVDLWSDEFDIEPIKNKEPQTVLDAMKTMFKRKHIKKPYASIRTDDGNEFKGVFKKYLYDNSILHRVGEPGRHQQLANVESLNKVLGRLLNGYMNYMEETTGKEYKEWTNVIDVIRTDLNTMRKKKQIKQQVLLEQFSDDDTPIEKVKEIMKRGPKQNLPPRPEAPKYIFV